MNLLLEVIDAAEVSYNWNDAGTTGNIKYNEEDEQELAVYTMVSNEDWGYYFTLKMKREKLKTQVKK